MLTSLDHYGVAQARKREGKLVKQWKLPGPVHALAVDHTGNYLITGNGNGTAYVLRLKP